MARENGIRVNRCRAGHSAVTGEKDGESAWNDPDLIADEKKNYGYGNPIQNGSFAHLRNAWALDTKFIIPAHPAYEDVWYYLWKERRLPVNVDPLKSELANSRRTRTTRAHFRAGLGSRSSVSVLPLRRQENVEKPCAGNQACGFSAPTHMFSHSGAIPPSGFRLPPRFDPVDVAARKTRNNTRWRDPLAQREPLPQRRGVKEMKEAAKTVAAASRKESALGWAVKRPSPGESAPWIVRTALCVEPRDGRLYVFMPPAPLLEDYLDLITAIEETAAELKMPVLIEGYGPPQDERLQHIKVTPDPGVIEVNMYIRRRHGWDELVKNTTTLYRRSPPVAVGYRRNL